MVLGAALAGFLVWRRRRQQQAHRSSGPIRKRPPPAPRDTPLSPSKRTLKKKAPEGGHAGGHEFQIKNPLRGGAYPELPGSAPSPLALPSPALRGGVR